MLGWRNNDDRVSAPGRGATVIAVVGVMVGCSGSDSAVTVDKPPAVNSTIVDLVPAEEIRAAEAVAGVEASVGDTVDLDGVVVEVSSVRLSGDDLGPWLETAVRIENRTSNDVDYVNIELYCAGNDEGGGWQADSTFDLLAGVPAGSFDEGTVNLLVPGDGRYGETRERCVPPANIVVGPFIAGAVTANRAVFELPTAVIDAINATDGVAVETPESEPVDLDPTTTSSADEDATARAQSVIVQLSDLPAGWSPAPLSEDDGADSCFDSALPGDDRSQTVLPDSNGVETVDAAFQQSEFGPFLSFRVASGVDEGRVDSEQIASVFETCDGFVDDQGSAYSVFPVSFPEVGDATFATKIEVTNPDGFPFSMLIVIAQVDDVVLLSIGVSIMSAVDAELVATLTKVMADRV